MGKIVKFFKDWQNLADSSKADAQRMVDNPDYTNHVKALNWYITIVGTVAFIWYVFF